MPTGRGLRFDAGLASSDNDACRDRECHRPEPTRETRLTDQGPAFSTLEAPLRTSLDRWAGHPDRCFVFTAGPNTRLGGTVAQRQLIADMIDMGVLASLSREADHDERTAAVRGEVVLQPLA